VRVARLGFAAALFLLTPLAWADRVAVVALESPGHPTPVLEADQLGADLLARGYRVIAAADGNSGLRHLQSDARIDLLLTDVGLPGGLNGRQVADAGRVSRPALKVLFITGYADGAAVGNTLLEPGMEVVTKPFVIAELTERVRRLVER
jgi:CheY-like chemotaxis protein